MSAPSENNCVNYILGSKWASNGRRTNTVNESLQRGYQGIIERWALTEVAFSDRLIASGCGRFVL